MKDKYLKSPQIGNQTFSSPQIWKNHPIHKKVIYVRLDVLFMK